MKCDNCDNFAYTIFDLACDKCGTRMCKDCASVYKCYYCRIPYCQCYGVFCPNERTHYWIELTSHYIAQSEDYFSPKYNEERIQESLDDLYAFWNVFDNDTEFVKHVTKYKYDKFLFTCCDRQVVKAGKLDVNLARYIIEKLNWQIDPKNPYTERIGNEDIHRELDKLWQWYLESMDTYHSLDEARQVAKIIVNFNRSEFWYA